MDKTVLMNGLMNVIFALVFVFLNRWALRSGLEETFVTLALFYGIVVIVGNAVYIMTLKKAGTDVQPRRRDSGS